MAFFGLSKPAPVFAHPARLFSSRSSGSESDSDFETEFLDKPPVQRQFEDKPKRDFKVGDRDSSKSPYQQYKQIDASEILGGIRQFIEEKADASSHENWVKYM